MKPNSVRNGECFLLPKETKAKRGSDIYLRHLCTQQGLKFPLMNLKDGTCLTGPSTELMD